MSLDDVVSVTITRATATVSRQSFAIPLIAAYHTHWLDRVHTYSASTMLATMVTEGFAITEPAYKAAVKMLSQDPKPKTLKIGRLGTSWSQIVSIVPTVANSTVYSGRVNDQPWTFTSDSSATLAEVCTGIAAAIDALAGVTAVSTGTAVTVTTGTAATLVNFSSVGTVGAYSVTDGTDRTDIATGLAAIYAADRKWYGFVIDSVGEPDIEDAAAWAETNVVVFFPSTADSGVDNASVTTDVGSDLLASGYRRTALFYHEESDSFMGAAALATMLPYDPGAVTLYYRSPIGPAVSNLSATQQSALTGKNVNYLVDIAEKRVVLDGKSAGGEFIDIQIVIDWITSRSKEDLFAFLTAAPKIPYIDKSVETAKGVILGVLQLGVNRGVIAGDPAPFVEAPLVADVSPTDRANRLLPDMTFSCRLTGGIKNIEIAGTVSV